MFTRKVAAISPQRTGLKPAMLSSFLGGAVVMIVGMGPVQGAAETWAPVNGVVPASGFVVDMQNRAEALYFHHAVYMASEGAETRMGWTSRYGGCTCLLYTSPSPRDS